LEARLGTLGVHKSAKDRQKTKEKCPDGSRSAGAKLIGWRHFPSGEAALNSAPHREVPLMQDVERWGVLTIGTGLGNVRFTNRRNATAKKVDDRNGDRKDKKPETRLVRRR
jgi:hypothetical protein